MDKAGLKDTPLRQKTIAEPASYVMASISGSVLVNKAEFTLVAGLRVHRSPVAVVTLRRRQCSGGDAAKLLKHQ